MARVHLQVTSKKNLLARILLQSNTCNHGYQSFIMHFRKHKNITRISLNEQYVNLIHWNAMRTHLKHYKWTIHFILVKQTIIYAFLLYRENLQGIN